MSDETAAVRPPAPPRRSRWHYVFLAVGLAIFAFAALLLARVLAKVSYADITAAIAGTSGGQIAGACLFTATSYLALTGYDGLALRQLRLKVRYRTAALASFTAYAVSFTLGFPLLTGASVRYWIYARSGLSAASVATVTVIASLTFWFGMVVLIALAFIIDSEVGSLTHLSRPATLSIGIAALLAIAVYLVYVSGARRHMRFQGVELELPGLSLTLGQMAVGIVDLCSAAAAGGASQLPRLRRALCHRHPARHREQCAGRHRRVRGHHPQHGAGSERGSDPRRAAAVPHDLLHRAVHAGAGDIGRFRDPAAAAQAPECPAATTGVTRRPRNARATRQGSHAKFDDPQLPKPDAILYAKRQL